jgi:formiminotetrahydrofolate cyclodeaminase
LATSACIEGAALNVRINVGSLKDEKTKGELVKRMNSIREQSAARFKAINAVVEKKLA